MQLLRRYSFVCAIASAAVLVVGCNNNKVAECNKLIDSINKGHTLVTNFQGKDAASANKLASELDGIIADLEKVNLSDKKLTSFQSRFTQIYKDLGKAFRTTGQALSSVSAAEQTPENEEKIKAEVKAAGRAAEEAAKQADNLANEINSYCGGSDAQ